MAKLETVIKEAIARGARRQVRVLVLPLRREVLRLRRRMAEIQGTLTTLRQSATRWNRLMDAAPTIPPVSPEEAKAARLSPRLVQSLRERLGLSQMALGRLVGVSAPAVAHWEAGESTPTGQNRATLVALRKVGMREVKVVAPGHEDDDPGLSHSSASPEEASATGEDIARLALAVGSTCDNPCQSQVMVLWRLPPASVRAPPSAE